MNERTLIVAGLGRCGSSLTMQILDAGGIRCLGSYPDFEDERTAKPVTQELITSMAGGAMKVLDPHRNKIPHQSNCAVIWLDRDADEQATSQVKLLAIMVGLMGNGRSQRKAFANQIRQDRTAALRALNPAWPRLTLSFEALITQPVESIERIAAFVPGFHNSERIVRNVLHRDVACRPDMAIEKRLCAQGPLA